MNPDKIIIDEQSLTKISETLKTYSENYREIYVDALKKLRANGAEWNDEDFSMLLSAISSFKTGIDEIEASTQKISDTVNKKIDAIHILHGMKL